MATVSTLMEAMLTRAVIAALALGSAIPALAQEETPPADDAQLVLDAIVGPYERMATLSGVPVEEMFARPPRAEPEGEGWRVEVPSWRLTLADGRGQLGCWPELWEATLADDGSVSAHSDGDLICEFRIIGPDAVVNRILLQDRTATIEAQPDGTMVWGLRGESGLWDEKSALGGVAYDFGAYDLSLRTGPSDDGLHDAVFAAEIADARWEDRMFGAVFTVDRLTYETRYEGVDVPALLALVAEVAALDYGVDKVFDPQAEAQIADLVAQMDGWIGAAQEAARMDGLSIELPFLPETQITGLHYSWSLTDVGSDDLAATMMMGLSEMTLVPPVEAATRWLPERFVVSLRADPVPMHSLLGIIADTMRAGSYDDPMQMIFAMGAALRGAETTLSVDALEYRAPGMTFDVAGTLAAAEAAPLGMTGGAEVAVTGLDAAIAALRAAPDGAEIAAALTALSLVGQPADPVDGRPARRFVFELGPEGQILLNGTDLSVLLP